MTKKKLTLTLVIGGSKSGKSRFAEQIISNKKNVTYIATGPIINDDIAWNEKIRQHKQRRPKHWKLIESSQDLNLTVNNLKKHQTVLIDSLGGFISSNIDQSNDSWKVLEKSFLKSLCSYRGSIILVIEEVGLSIVPHTTSGIIYRERIGTLSQRLQLNSDKSWLIIIGRAINLNKISNSIYE
tara:strand:+ start:73 stop:621 length:549 start_codon:yes stop_codon:yes gene_type:complete